MATTKFSVKLRGYDTKEVNEYIEKIHKEYADVCAYLQEKVKSLEALLGSQEDIANAMVRAQSVARIIEEEGQLKVGKLLGEAEIKAQGITSKAEIEAGRIVRDASEKYNEIRNDMQKIFNISLLFLKETDAIKDMKTEDISLLGSETQSN